MSLARIVEHFHKLGPLDSKHIDADVLGQARTADLSTSDREDRATAWPGVEGAPDFAPSTAFWT